VLVLALVLSVGLLIQQSVGAFQMVRRANHAVGHTLSLAVFAAFARSGESHYVLLAPSPRLRPVHDGASRRLCNAL
jgi:hypothetical protein